MRRVEFAFYLLPPRPGSGPRAKPYRSGWKMTAEDAAKLGAVGQVLGSAEFRDVPETEEEVRREQVNYQSAGLDSVQPPPKG